MVDFKIHLTVEDAMGYILKRYVETSGAFTKNSDNSYTMNANDAQQLWNYTNNKQLYSIGYHIPSVYQKYPNYPVFSQDELNTYQYAHDKIAVYQYYFNTTSDSYQSTITLKNKADLLFSWLGLKLITWTTITTPPTLGAGELQFQYAAQNLTDLTALNQQIYNSSIGSIGSKNPPPPPPCNTPSCCKASQISSLTIIKPQYCVGSSSIVAYTINPGSGDLSTVNATVLASSVQAALNLTTHIGMIHIVYTQKSSCSGIIDFLVCAIKKFISGVLTIVESIINITIGVIDFVIKAWNEVVAPFLGTVEHVERNIVTQDTNFIVDTVWNIVFLPNLPKNNDFTVSSDLQNFLNIVINKNVISDWSTTMKSIISPIDGKTTQEVVQFAFDKSTSIISNIGETLGIFTILSQLGGENLVNSALENIYSRVLNHLTKWFSNVPVNSTKMDNFINQNSFLLNYPNEINQLSEQAVQFKNTYSSFGNNILRYQFGSSLTNSQFNQMNFQGIYQNVKGTFSSDLIEWVASSLSGIGGSIKKGTIAIQILAAVIAAFYTSWIFAQLNVASLYTYNDIISNPIQNIPLLPALLQLNLQKARIITAFWNSQLSLYNQAVGLEAWVQGTKMGSDLFALLKLDNSLKDISWSVSFQIANTFVFGMGGFITNWLFNNDVATLKKTHFRTFSDNPATVIANLIQIGFGVFSTVTGLIFTFAEYFSGIPIKLHNYLVLPALSLILIFISLAITAWYLLPKINDINAWTIFGTALLASFLPIVILKAKFNGGEPDPLNLAVTSIVAFYCQFGQFITSINHLPQY